MTGGEQPNDDYDVVVVGAGIIGCMIARELAVDHDVLVVDKRGVAAEATGLAGGLIAPTMFYGDLPDAARHANEFIREFDGTNQFSFTERHRYDLLTAGEVEEARERADRLADQGFPVRYVDDEAVASGTDLIMDDFAGALHYEDTGWVDPYSYAVALKEDAEHRGAAFVVGPTVEDIVVENDAVVGIRTDDGVFRGETTVVAAGWRTPTLLDGIVEIPVRPYRTQCVVLDPGRELDDSFPLGRIGSRKLYFRPEHNGDLLMGGGRSLPSDPETASSACDESFKMRIADAVPELLEGFERARFVNGWAGVDGATPDARPIIDDEVGPDGLVVATGFNGLGVMASPMAGGAVRSYVTGEPEPFSTDPFRLDRFDERSADFELYSTSDI